jgi:glycosyltransferase involved in cell wall biosynthesis
MRILYHHRTLGDGAEGIHVSAIVDAFSSLGHDIKIAAMIGEKTNVATARTRFLSFLKRIVPGMVHEFLELGYTLLGYRMLRGRMVGWDPDFLYERYALFNFAGLLAAWRQNIPLVLEVNSPLAYERITYEYLTLRQLARRCERFICSKADLVVVVSTPLKEYLIEQEVPADKIIVVPNGVDSTIFRPDISSRQVVRDGLGFLPDTVVIGFVGMLRPWHGVGSLCESIWNLKQKNINVHLLIVGDGPSRSEIDAFIQERKIEECVTITGRVLHSEISSYLTAFDIGVSPRANFYASPMKILEYMATGLAVVAPRMPNIQDIITDGVNGLLFDPESIEDLTATLLSLTKDSNRRKQLGQSARENVLTQRTWAQIAQYVIDRLGLEDK